MTYLKTEELFENRMDILLEILVENKNVAVMYFLSVRGFIPKLCISDCIKCPVCLLILIIYALMESFLNVIIEKVQITQSSNYFVVLNK